MFLKLDSFSFSLLSTFATFIFIVIFTDQTLGVFEAVSHKVDDATSKPKFVPNYLCNPEFPYSESAEAFAKRLGLSNSSSSLEQTMDQKIGSNYENQTVSCFETSILNKPIPLSSKAEEDTLVLKCRLANSNEKDFIEIEIAHSCLKFETLVATCLSEFEIDRQKLQKIRKLPNTIIRNDRDVNRLIQYQEIEVVVDK